MFGNYTFKEAVRSVGKGWRPLIRLLYAAKPENTAVVQVKEKFGGLRFYISAADKWYHDLISEVENISYSICERCGKPGYQSKAGWILTLCEEHHKERDNELR